MISAIARSFLLWNSLGFFSVGAEPLEVTQGHLYFQDARKKKLNKNSNHFESHEAFPPLWRSIGQSLDTHDDETWASTGWKVAIAEDPNNGSLILADAYPIVDQRLVTVGIKIQTYTFVPRLDNWVPLDDPIHVHFPDGRETDFVLFDLDLTNNCMVLCHGPIHPLNEEEDDDSNGTARVHVWHLSETKGGGRVKVFWEEIGDPVQFQAENIELFGLTVSLAEVGGITFAVGVPVQGGSGEDERGRAEVYSWNGKDWVLKGSPVHVNLFAFGSVVRLSKDGNVLAVAAGGLDESTTCFIQVYEYWNDSQCWETLGQAKSDGDLLCSEMDLSADGKTLVSGNRYLEEQDGSQMLRGEGGNIGAAKGHVRVWVLKEGNQLNRWETKGSDLDTVVPQRVDMVEFGANKQLSGNGNRLTLTTTHRDEDNLRSRICSFEWDEDENNWELVDSPMPLSYPSISVGMTSSCSALVVSQWTGTGGLVEGFTSNAYYAGTSNVAE